MPVLTMDITVGTSKVEKLNLSHNAISDIRKGKSQVNIYKGASIFVSRPNIVCYIRNASSSKCQNIFI